MGLVLGLVFAAGVFLLIPVSNKESKVDVRLRTRLTRKPTIDEAVWPEVVDDIASAVRAGMSLQQAVFHVASHGAPDVRELFTAAHKSYLGSGDFPGTLTIISERCQSTSVDKFCAAMHIAYDVGGTDLVALLRSLSAVLRSDLAMRAEIKARQSWTINGARLAVAAPWVTVLLLSLRTDAAAAYRSSGGIHILVVCAVVSVIAYQIMIAIGRLPQNERIVL